MRLLQIGDLRPLIARAVSNGRVHPEWRLLVAVISFCVAAAYSTSLWNSAIASSREAYWVLLGALITLLIIGIRWRCWFAPIFFTTLTFCLGLAWGQIRLTELHQSFTLRQDFVDVQGIVERVEEREYGLHRLLIEPTKLAGYDKPLPKKIRVFARTDIGDDVQVGQRVTFNAKLSAPNGPTVPGGYDFSRAAYFAGIGVDAIALSPITGMSIEQDKGFRYWILKKRVELERFILRQISGQAGAVTVAITVGFRNHLTGQTTDSLRRAGLSHLLAISGLHMGLVTAVSFYIFEFLFAAFPSMALRIMPRKLAVIPTWLVALSYLFLSGAATSTTRAFIMVSVGLLAILAGRKVVSLRSVALAALFITFWKPESALSIGFQMSFAATAGLVVFYEAVQSYTSKWRDWGRSWYLRTVGYIVAIAATSLVAQLSVAPFSLYHFQSLSIAGIVANILVLPVVSFWVMPLLVVGALGSPLVSFSLFSSLIEAGLEYILSVANMVAAMPYAMLYVLPVSNFVFCISVFSLLFWLVIRSRFSFVFLVAAGGLFVFEQRDIVNGALISKSGTVVMVHQNNELYSVGGKANSFRDKAWKQYWGFSPSEIKKPLKRSCDVNGCGYDVFSNHGYKLQKAKTIAGVRRACINLSIVIMPEKYKRYCKGSALIIGERELAEKGPLAVFFKDSKNVLSIEWSRP